MNVQKYSLNTKAKKDVGHHEVMIGEQKTIFSLNDRGAALHLFLFHHSNIDGTGIRGSSPCEPKQHYVKFMDSKKSDINVIDSRDGSKQIQNMVHLKGGVALIASDLTLYIYAFEKQYFNSYIQRSFDKYRAVLKTFSNITNLRSHVTLNQGESNFAQLAYNGKSQTLYIIFYDQIIYVNVDVMRDNEIIKDFKVMNQLGFGSVEAALTSYNFLYVATTEAVHVFESNQQTGELHLHQVVDENVLYPASLRILEITDIAIGGQKGNLLYVLDRHNGVTILQIDLIQDFGQSIYTSKILTRVGIISVSGGFKLDQYNDDSIIVLTEHPGTIRQHRAIEFNLNIQKGDWFVLNQYAIDGRASDVDISKRIAIVRGVDSHKVIFHSIWKGFQPSQEKEVFYAPHLKQLDFFEQKYGFDQFEDWHFNQSHAFIFAVTGKQLLLIPWQEVDASIQCYSDAIEDQDSTFLYTFRANTTDCEEKKKNLATIIPDLTICNIEQNFTVKFSGVLVNSRGGKSKILQAIQQDFAYVTILVVLIIFIIIILVFVRLYKRYIIKKGALNREIQGFVSKGYRLDDRNTENSRSDKIESDGNL